MTSPDGMLHRKLPPGAVLSGRDTGALIGAEDVEQTSPEYIASGLLRIREALRDLARSIENRSYPVDEYNSAPITGAATEAQVVVQPIYEYMPEKITSILVAGPPSSAVTLTLGDRQLAVVIPATGILPIAPLAMLLNRNDSRILQAGTPGIFFLELMGYADLRFPQ